MTDFIWSDTETAVDEEGGLYMSDLRADHRQKLQLSALLELPPGA